jgi:molybdopterin synthase sulfur carrier subunit
MRIRVRFFTILRELIGKREEEALVQDGASVKEVLDLLSERYGKEFSDYLFEGKKLREHIQILLNGTNIMTLEGVETRLKDDCTLAVIPPMEGGI